MSRNEDRDAEALAIRLRHTETFKQAVRDEVISVLVQGVGPKSLNKPSSRTRRWYPTAEAWQLLDLRSAEHLRELRRNLPFKENLHYRRGDRKLNSRRPTYEFHIENCRKLLDGTPRHKMQVRKLS